LKKKYRLAIISNIDNDLFAFSAKHLKVKFDWVITAEQAKSYKPSLHNFKFAIDRIGVSPEKILHIAQSIYHDIIPAKKSALKLVFSVLITASKRRRKVSFTKTEPNCLEVKGVC